MGERKYSQQQMDGVCDLAILLAEELKVKPMNPQTSVLEQLDELKRQIREHTAQAVAIVSERDATIERLTAELEKKDRALQPFARVADKGKHGGRFLIASASYVLGSGKLDASPRESHWHWDDFEAARAALSVETSGK